MYIVLSMCCPSGATCSYIYKGGVGIAPGVRGFIFPPASRMPGKKNFGNYMEWQGQKSYNTSCYIYKTIMLKKLVNCSYVRKTKKIFRQIILLPSLIVENFFIGHIRLTFDFRPFVLLEKKLFLTIYGFLIFRPSF